MQCIIHAALHQCICSVCCTTATSSSPLPYSQLLLLLHEPPLPCHVLRDR